MGAAVAAVPHSLNDGCVGEGGRVGGKTGDYEETRQKEFLHQVSKRHCIHYYTCAAPVGGAD